MSWKFVFNSKTDDIGKAAMIANRMFCEYKFFTCGNDVYFYDSGKFYKTGITVEDLF